MKKILLAAFGGLFVLSSLMATIINKHVLDAKENSIQQIRKDSLPHQPKDTSRVPVPMPDTSRKP